MSKFSCCSGVCVLAALGAWFTALALESDMLNFCSRPGPAAVSKKRRKRRQKTDRELEELKKAAAGAQGGATLAPAMLPLSD